MAVETLTPSTQQQSVPFNIGIAVASRCFCQSLDSVLGNAQNYVKDSLTASWWVQGSDLLARAVVWRLQCRACLTHLFWERETSDFSLRWHLDIFFLSFMFCSGNSHFLPPCSISQSCFLAEPRRLPERSITLSSRTPVVVSSTAGPWLWIWLCSSHGEPCSDVTADTRCLGGGELPVRTLLPRVGAALHLG